MRSILSLSLPALALALAPDLAHACGGCFHGEQPTPQPGRPNDTAQVVTDHRMVLSRSAAQSTLWDQIRYSGSPAEFIWVLPIADASHVDVGVADNNFIDALDRMSAPQVVAPRMYCAPSGMASYSAGGCGYGGGGAITYDSGGTSGSMNATENTAVGQTGQATVGPYDVRVVSTHAGEPGFDQWLLANGFMVPSDTMPALRYYSDRHFDFLVVRLRPQVGVQAMQPIRVTTPGYAPTLPLRMIAAGISDRVGLTLMVIAANGARTSGGTFTTTLAPQSVVYDFATNRSNYREVFAAATANGNWVLESTQGVYQTLSYNPDMSNPGRAIDVDAGTADDAHTADDASAQGDMDAQGESDSGIPAADLDAGAAPADDTGAPQGSDSAVPRRDPYMDLRIAFAGLHGAGTLSRLRTLLGRTALDRDLTIDATNVNWERVGVNLYTTSVANPPACPDGGTASMTPPTPAPARSGGCAVGSVRRGAARYAGGWLLASAVGTFVLRRRARRRGRR